MAPKEIVISGLSGRFPESENIEEFWENLIDGKDLITEDDRRWDIDAFDMPRRMGKIPALDKFDADFFGVSAKQANFMDPRTRILLEVTYEAIVDAGVNPRELYGSKTGVYVCGTLSEAHDIWLRSMEEPNSTLIPGTYPCLIPNRISYAFNFNGPSYLLDTGCSGGLSALSDAILAIQNGYCDSAVVCGANINLCPLLSLAFTKFNMLSATGKCKAFDADRDGFVRSEGAVAIFICPKDFARRSYATVAGIRCNNDGYKPEGCTYPSKVKQAALFRDLYESVGISPLEVGYIEAHGTGTAAGDRHEIHSVAEIFCPGRKGPLLIGSLKSNMGHAECVSGLCSVAKILLSSLAGVLPPNLHFNNPNPDCEAILDGRIKVVAEQTPLNAKYVGINTFGFGGSSAHVLLKFDDPEKLDVPAEKNQIPKIIFASGRTASAVQVFLEKCVKPLEDPKYMALLHNISKTPTPRHPFGGYMILKDNCGPAIIVEKKSSKNSIWFVYSGLGGQWIGMARDMMSFQVFRSSIEKSKELLKEINFNLMERLETEDQGELNNLKNALVCITSIQIALTDMLESLGVYPDGIIGHSNGESASAYADKCFTRDQTLRSSYAKARGFLESGLKPGTLASIGLSLDEIEKRRPPGIFPAIHNTKSNTTVGGTPEAIREFVEEIKKEGHFAKEVPSALHGYHTPLVHGVKPFMLKLMQEAVLEPNLRSDKWLSTSIPECNWGSDVAKYSSAEYHVNNALSPVYLFETLAHVPEDAVVIEIGPHCFLQTILKENLHPTAVSLGLMNCRVGNQINYFLQSVSKLFLSNIGVDVGALYEKVQFPVQGKIPFISPIIKWDHSESWAVPNYKEERSSGKGTKYGVSLSNDEYLGGHVVANRILYPATGYLFLVWKAFAKQHNKSHEEFPVRFENVVFRRTTELNSLSTISFFVSILPLDGNFVITESGDVVCSGKISAVSTTSVENEMFDLEPSQKQLTQDMLDKPDFYKILRLRGYGYKGVFQGVTKIDMTSNWAEIQWNNNWVSFLDTVLQVELLKIKVKGLSLPVRLSEAVFHPQALLNSTLVNGGVLTAEIRSDLKVVQCPGIQFRGLQSSSVSSFSRGVRAPVNITEQTFQAYNDPPDVLTSEDQILEFFLGIAMDNTSGDEFVVTEVLGCLEPDRPSLFTTPMLTALTAGSFESCRHNVVCPNSEDWDIDEEGLKFYNTLPQLESQTCSHLIVTDNADAVLEFNLLSEQSFLIIQNKDFRIDTAKFCVVAEKHSQTGKFFLLRTCAKSPSAFSIISIDQINLSWIEPLKELLKARKQGGQENIVLQTSLAISGMAGFIRCLLKEQGKEFIRSFETAGLNLPENISEGFLQNKILISQMQKDLVFNIYRDETWGCLSNYLLDESQLKSPRACTEAFVGIETVGDLSSLTWIESPCKLNRKNPIEIHYSGLNFKDVMSGLGKLATDSMPEVLHKESNIIGLEFSGFFEGRRICGMSPKKCLATVLKGKPSLMWNIPKDWSLEEAATVPVVYATAIYSLIMRGDMQPHQSVLIHSGTGGVGLAAITLALGMNCQVFATVGTAEKRDFLMTRFPQLLPTQISNSRNARKFEKDILAATKGRGVDLILNSLADEKLQASIRCLAPNGRFIEIGKDDLSKNSALGMQAFLKTVQVHGVCLSTLMCEETSQEKLQLENLMEFYIQTGLVKPLPSTVFAHDKVEKAFRFMASGKHIGKVVIKVREDLNNATVQALLRTYFYHDKTYLVIGGLGGMGLELVDWMVERGAREIYIVSRSKNLKTSFQEYMVGKWRALGANIYLESIDVSNGKQVCTLLLEIISVGPLGGIFNLALSLEDALFENQSPETFASVANAKAIATKHLDALSRQLAPNIDHFVVFSSVVANKGHAGQTNYGYANSVMERICELRRGEGLPALAIQWGLVGDVGYSHDILNGKSILGMEAQSIKSCIETLDFLLQQKSRTVVSSFVVATRNEVKNAMVRTLDQSVAGLCARILGIQDLEKVDPNLTLSELGMDSLMSAELKQVLIAKKNISLPSQAYAKLTFKVLRELQ